MFLRSATALLAVVAVGVAGCGSGASSSNAPNPNAPEKSPPGDIPDNQVYVPYKLPNGHVSLKVPEGWSQTKSGGAVTFTDKLNSITIESVPAAANLNAATTVQRPAGKAVLIKYLQRSKPDPVTGRSRTDAVQRYVWFHNGRRVSLTLSGPRNADNVDPWKLVSSSVRWTP